MSESFDYDQMVQEALMQVVRKALTSASEKGLPSPHHFYITFQTDRPDVLMTDTLKEQHTGEMTIVLQHQYWNLNVTPEAFSVVLSFDGTNQEITVPFAAITNFLDPSVKFSLPFEATPPQEEIPQEGQASSGEDSDTEESTSKVVTLDSFRKK